MGRGRPALGDLCSRCPDEYRDRGGRKSGRRWRKPCRPLIWWCERGGGYLDGQTRKVLFARAVDRHKRLLICYLTSILRQRCNKVRELAPRRSCRRNDAASCVTRTLGRKSPAETVNGTSYTISADEHPESYFGAHRAMLMPCRTNGSSSAHH